MPDADLAQILVSAAVYLGIPSVLTLIVKGIIQQVSGRANRERAKNSGYLADSVRANALADAEATKRRKTQEYASELRRQIIENGHEPLPWPEELEKTLTPAETKKLRTNRKPRSTE